MHAADKGFCAREEGAVCESGEEGRLALGEEGRDVHFEVEVVDCYARRVRGGASQELWEDLVDVRGGAGEALDEGALDREVDWLEGVLEWALME